MNSIIKNLNQYPAKIFAIEQQILNISQSKISCEERMSLFNSQLNLDIANDLTLKNETMRKAEKLKLQTQDVNYQRLQKELQDLTLRLRNAEIELTRLRNEFGVRKLEARMAIAQMEVAA